MKVKVTILEETDAERAATMDKIGQVNWNRELGKHFGSREEYWEDMVLRDVAVSVTEYETSEMVRKAFNEWYKKASAKERYEKLRGVIPGIE